MDVGILVYLPQEGAKVEPVVERGLRAWAARAGVGLTTKLVGGDLVVQLKGADRDEVQVLLRMVQRSGHRVGIFL